MQVLRQLPIMHLLQAEHTLCQADHGLDLGLPLRTVAVLRRLDVVDCAVAPKDPVAKILARGTRLANYLALTLVSLITPDARLVAMQQMRQRVPIVRIGAEARKIAMPAVGSAPSATLHRLERDVRLVGVTAVGSLPICVTLVVYAVNQLTFLRTQIFRRTVKLRSVSLIELRLLKPRWGEDCPPTCRQL